MNNNYWSLKVDFDNPIEDRIYQLLGGERTSETKEKLENILLLLNYNAERIRTIIERLFGCALEEGDQFLVINRGQANRYRIESIAHSMRLSTQLVVYRLLQDEGDGPVYIEPLDYVLTLCRLSSSNLTSKFGTPKTLL